MAQGSCFSDHKRTALSTLLLCLIILGGVGGLLKNAEGAGYPDTYSCDLVPTLEFPTTVTIDKSYLFIANCSDVQEQAGDFVTMYVATPDRGHLKSISKYEVTDAGVEWVSPLTDSNGSAWEQVHIDPNYFDCNSTGVPYSLHVHWDGQHNDANFLVVCPTIEFEYHRIEVPYWEKLRITAHVTDNFGYSMKGVSCTADVLSFSFDDNYATVKQEKAEEITDIMGNVRFEFDTGFMADLLQGYEYTTFVRCLGGDANFTFEITQTDNELMKNPLYYTIVYVSDNIVPILLTLILAAIVISVGWFIMKPT